MGLKQQLDVTCQDATFLLQKKEEGKLTAREWIGLTIHLSYCNLCRRFSVQTKALNKYLSRFKIGDAATNISMPEEKKQVIQNEIIKEMGG